jgi:transposase
MTQTIHSMPQAKAARRRTALKANLSSLTVGFDLGDQWGQLCWLDPDGEVVDEGRVKMTSDALSARFASISKVRVALETGAHSLWVSQLLTSLGHEVVVANSRDLAAISQSDQKSDRNDAEKLARYARVDPSILHPITHRTSEQQADLTVIRARAALVRTRPLLVNAARGLVKPFGTRLPKCDPDQFAARCRGSLPEAVDTALTSLLEEVTHLTTRIKQFDEQIQAIAKTKHPEAAILRTVPGVGPLTSLCFVLTLGDKARFADSRDAACYLGLQPKKSQSGERDPQLGITRAGNRYARSLLVECAHKVLHVFTPDSALKQWGLKRAARGGKNAKKRAIVAVARKLAVLLHRMWVKQERFEPFREARPQSVTAGS